MTGLTLFVLCGHQVSLFAAFLVFLWLVYLWETYLDYRQRRTIIRTLSSPQELVDVIDEDEFARSKSYALDKASFSFVKDAYNMVETTVILYFSLLPWLWYKTVDHSTALNLWVIDRFQFDMGMGPDSEIKCSLLFLLYVTLFMFVDFLPWSIYYNFVIEARHGFNKQTFGFFIKDRIKALLLSIIIGFPVMSVLIWIIKVGGPRFYLYAYFFALFVTLFMMFVYPEFIAPLFDRYAPLPEGSLRTKIEELAARIKFPLKKLLVVEGSKRSSHSNAYFYGFGNNKRIVLYDTLIRGFKFPNQTTQDTDQSGESSELNADAVARSSTRGCALEEEVVAVLAHELGHWKLGHTLIHLFIGQANLLLMFAVFSTLMNIEPIFISFGFTRGVPILLRLCVVFQFIFSPYNTILDFLMTVMSRRLEFQADRFSVGLDYGPFLKSALLTLHKDNLSFPVSDWLYSMCNYSHPPLLERLEAIDKCLAKSK